jgi:hypothetical protein
MRDVKEKDKDKGERVEDKYRNDEIRNQNDEPQTSVPMIYWRVKKMVATGEAHLRQGPFYVAVLLRRMNFNGLLSAGVSTKEDFQPRILGIDGYN